jgi:hypothetical protein
VATEHDLYKNIGGVDVCTEFEMLKVNVPIIFLGTVGFSLPSDGRYYKVARKRFVDTVCMQDTVAILIFPQEMFLPLQIFGTSFVSDLSAAPLDIIVGEEASIKNCKVKSYIRKYDLQIRCS